MSETVTRLRAEETGRDRYNNPTTELVPVVLPQLALFDPGSSVEAPGLSRTTRTTTQTLLFPGGFPDLTADDQVTVRGRTWQVDGDPAIWPDGTVVRLSAVEG